MAMLRVIGATIGLGLLFMLAPADAAEIKLLASNALKSTLEGGRRNSRRRAGTRSS